MLHVCCPSVHIGNVQLEYVPDAQYNDMDSIVHHEHTEQLLTPYHQGVKVCVCLFLKIE